MEFYKIYFEYTKIDKKPNIRELNNLEYNNEVKYLRNNKNNIDKL